MKRKLFSAILFGALLTASTSGLTSCKDYDDDISNLQSQIDKLATADQLSAKVSELQAAISAAQSAAESKAAAAQTVADAAKAAAADAAAAASKAQGAADDAAKAAAAAAEVGKAAQAAVDKLAAEAATKADLEAAAQAAQAAVEAIKAEHATDKAKIEAAIETGLNSVKDEIAATNEKLAGLATRLDTVEEKLAALEAGEGQEEVLAAIQAEVEDIADVLESLGISVSEMITAVHLYSLNGLFDNALNFYQVKEAVDRTFPFGDEVEDVTNETVEFKKGTVRALEDSVLVRISPASAVLHAEDISLINTQGKEFDASLFESIEVKEFNREAPLTTKAAGNNNTGLWVVKFKLNKDFDADKLNENAYYKKAQIIYALAVKNCDENLSEDRRVATEFGVTAAAPLAKHATTFSVQPASAKDATPVTNIHHRFTAYTNPLAGTFPASLKENDWKWKSGLNSDNDLKDGKANLTFDKEAKGDAQNAEKETPRQTNSVLAVSEGEKITIKFDAPVKAFYVTVDWKRAGESGKSEINAWNTYSYTNVGKVDDTGKVIEAAPIQYGDEGFISVDELKQYASQGDVIGFRVWAINLDGSMVDPDGTAFYVGIGQNADVSEREAEVKVKVTTWNASNGTNVGTVDVSEQFGVDFNSITFENETANYDGKADADGNDTKGYTPKVGASDDIEITMFDKDNTLVPASANDKLYTVKKLKVVIRNPKKLVDNKEYNIKATLKGTVGGATATVRVVNIKVTKEMPTELPEGLNVKRDALQDQYQVVKPTNFVVGTLTQYGYYNANGEFKTNQDENSWAPVFAADDVTGEGTQYISGIASTATSKKWGAASSSQMKSGTVRLNNTYVLDNAVLNSQKDLSFTMKKSRIFVAGGDTPAYTGDVAPRGFTFVPTGALGSLDLYDVENIAGQFVDNKTAHDVVANYSYKDISHRKDWFNGTGTGKTTVWDINMKADGSYETAFTWSATAVPANDDIVIKQDVPSITYMSWSYNKDSRFVSYKWAQKCIADGVSTPYTLPKFDDANEIQWVGDGKSYFLPMSFIQMYFGTKVAGLNANFDNSYAKSNLYNSVKVGSLKITEIYTVCNGIKNVYFAPIVSGIADAVSAPFSYNPNATLSADYIEFRQVQATQADHNETLVIKVMDCFGQPTTIELPIRVKGTVAAPAVASVNYTNYDWAASYVVGAGTGASGQTAPAAASAKSYARK